MTDSIKDRLKRGLIERSAAAQGGGAPDCDMVDSDGLNPMIVGLAPAVPDASPAQEADLLGAMDDGERDALIDSIEAKASKLGGFLWDAIEWQVAWFLAAHEMGERIAGVMDNPEEDDPSAPASPARRLAESMPPGTLEVGRLRRLLYESLDASALRFLAGEAGLPDDLAKSMLKSMIGDRE